MKKTMKFVAISLMALALFSCNKKNNEPCKASVLSLRIDEATLRAFEESQVATNPAETKTEVTSKVVLTLQPSGRTITLSDEEIGKAKSASGLQLSVGEAVTKVSMVANGTITDETNINTLQKKVLSSDIPLEAALTDTEKEVRDDNTYYKVVLRPVPGVARLEVSGKIEPVVNEKTQKSAFKSIEVTHVYMNNYLPTRNAEERTYTGSNGENGFATSPALDVAMYDVIAEKEAFEDRSKVAGYQLFPKKSGEGVSANGYYDHVILQLKVTYSPEAVAAGYLATPQTRFVTIQRFMKTTSGDLDSFVAGTIYKLNLAELNDAFKTTDNNTPDPNNPDTPDPEPKGKRILDVKVEPYTWTVENIKPDLKK